MMTVEWHEYMKMFIGLLVILNPMLAVPVFISLTEAMSDGERLSNARRTALAVGVVLSVATLLGQQILSLFGISRSGSVCLNNIPRFISGVRAGW